MSASPYSRNPIPVPASPHEINWAEKRAWVRYPSNLDAVCTVESGKQFPAVVDNISVGGLGLVTPLPLPRDMQFNVQLQSNFTNLLSAIPLRVCHAKVHRPGQWMIGCQFTRQLTEQERRTLL